jgi:peptidyl-prolyl cis-trans isomerase C
MVIADLAGSGQGLRMSGLLRRWLAEPFVHFVLAGVVLFAAYGLWGEKAGEDRNITVTAEQVERLKAIWAAEAMRLPDERDTADIIADHVREEALYREAQRLQLGDDDIIIKRRLAQKMAFLLYDQSEITEPDEAEMLEWFNANKARFRIPELRSLEHVYLNSEERGRTATSDAMALSRKLRDGADWQGLGDPFMLKRTYADIGQRETARAFGTGFASAAFALPVGHWSQPIPSAFGLHIVRIVAVTPPADADFSGQRPAIAAAWTVDQRSKANAAALDDLIAQYDVVIEK